MNTKQFMLMTPVIGFLLLASCNKSEQTADVNNEELTAPSGEIDGVIRTNESLEITELLSDLYEWHVKTEETPDFDAYVKPGDSVFVGIDEQRHQKRLKELKNTNFFTEAFLKNYNSIAQTIDKELKNGTATYYVGELPPYGNEADPWTNTQDYPEKYWNNLTITNLVLDNDNAACKWNWGEKDYEYLCRFKKVNGKWKVDYLEGFDYKEFTSGLYEEQ